jgi:hypothetical protein
VNIPPLQTTNDEARSRRGLLRALPVGLVGLAGCGGRTLFGSGGSAGSGTDGATPETPTGTATPTPEPTPTQTAPPGATPTPTGTVVARSPGDVLQYDEAASSLAVEPEGYYTVADASVVLRNTGERAFTRVELRADLFYHPPSGGRTRVAFAYDDRSQFGGGSLGPGQSATFHPRPLRFRRDGRADRTSDASDFSLATAFRRVEYD